MSPLEYSVFKTACNALNAGAVPAYTPSNYSIIESLEEFAASPANWLSLAVALLGFLAICAVVTLIVFLISTLISCFFESCLPILKRREKALLGDVLGAISGFVICTSIAMSLYKIDVSLVDSNPEPNMFSDDLQRGVPDPTAPSLRPPRTLPSCESRSRLLRPLPLPRLHRPHLLIHPPLPSDSLLHLHFLFPDVHWP